MCIFFNRFCNNDIHNLSLNDHIGVTVPLQQPNLLGVRARDVVAPLPYITLTGVESAQHVRDAPDHLVMEGDRLWLCGTVEGLLAAQGLPQVAIVDVRSVSKASVEQHLVQVVLAAKGGLLGACKPQCVARGGTHSSFTCRLRGCTGGWVVVQLYIVIV